MHAGATEHDLPAVTPTDSEESMRRLSFLQDDSWDEVNDDIGNRVRWFGHPFETDQLGASLIEYLPRSPGGGCVPEPL